MRSPLARVVRITGALIGAALAIALLAQAWVGVPITFRALLLVIGVVSAVRPAMSVLVLSATLPLAVPISTMLQAGLTTTGTGEAFVLAFLAGASLSCIRPGSAPLRLAMPVLALALLVVISLAFEVRQWQRQYPVRHIAAEIVTDVTGPGFFRSSPEWPEFRAGLRWLEVLAMAALVERALRRRPEMQDVAVRIWLTGGAAAASLAALRLAEVSLRQPAPLSAAVQVLRTFRVSTMQPDLNAAGSYFALLLLPAIVIGFGRRSPWLLGCLAPVILLALLMTHSLAALLATVIVTGAMIGVMLWRAGYRVGIAVAAAVGIAILVAGWAGTRNTHAATGVAARIRVEMGEVALRLAWAHPVFGVGVGKFVSASRPLISPELATLFPPAITGENAHNNYLQVLAELGVPGLVAFLAVLIAAVRPGAPPGHPIERSGMFAGVTAFAVTAMLGHPLLIAEVSAAFFLALGLTAGVAGEVREPDGPAA